MITPIVKPFITIYNWWRTWKKWLISGLFTMSYSQYQAATVRSEQNLAKPKQGLVERFRAFLVPQICWSLGCLDQHLVIWVFPIKTQYPNIYCIYIIYTVYIYIQLLYIYIKIYIYRYIIRKIWDGCCQTFGWLLPKTARFSKGDTHTHHHTFTLASISTNVLIWRYQLSTFITLYLECC